MGSPLFKGGGGGTYRRTDSFPEAESGVLPKVIEVRINEVERFQSTEWRKRLDRRGGESSSSDLGSEILEERIDYVELSPEPKYR